MNKKILADKHKDTSYNFFITEDEKMLEEKIAIEFNNLIVKNGLQNINSVKNFKNFKKDIVSFMQNIVKSFQKEHADNLRKTVEISFLLEDAKDKKTVIEKSLEKIEEASQKEKKQIKELTQIALFDKLTELYTRRYLNVYLNKAIFYAYEKNKEVFLYFFDIDHFKSFNDNNGHPAGDKILSETAHILHANARRYDRDEDAIDIAGRYGGEEFVMILYGLDQAQAEKHAENIRTQVENNKVKIKDKDMNVTISIGITNITQEDAGVLMRGYFTKEEFLQNWEYLKEVFININGEQKAYEDKLFFKKEVNLELQSINDYVPANTPEEVKNKIIAMYEERLTNVYTRADEGLYQSKNKGRNTVTGNYRD